MTALLRRRARDTLARVKQHIRRWRAVHLPDRYQRAYARWAMEQSARRQQAYKRDPEPGLLSIITAVWDRSPAGYLRELADSIAVQNTAGACEWLLVDNGCSASAISSEIARLSAFTWIRIVRLEKNAGIVGGLRAGLQAARGRYTMSVDGDDVLYPDTLRTVAHYIEEHAFPPLLYTDEDKTTRGKKFEAYLKPDWDPALMLNSPYVAHLGVVDRQKALALGAYTDAETEGSADWDLFMRFFIAGHTPVHIPEVLYSWRVHGESTAGNVANKSYIYSAQTTVLQRFVDSQREPNRYTVTESPLFPSTPHFRIARSSPGSYPTIALVLDNPSAAAVSLLDSVANAASTNAWVLLREAGLRVYHDDWLSEAECVFEMHRDAVMLGGLIVNRRYRVRHGGYVFGFAGVCGDPYYGRVSSPGYFGELWKRHSVSAVSSQFAVAKAAFLNETLRLLPETATVGFLGAWAGAHAMRTGKRVIYSPFLGGISQQPWPGAKNDSEAQVFAEINGDLIPDTRFYSRHFSHIKPFAIGI